MGELWSSWTFYIHLQNTNDWSYESYYKLFKCDHLNQAISLNNELGCEMLKKSLVFVMKEDIQPLWEEPKNRDGGSFSLKYITKTSSLFGGKSYIIWWAVI